MVTMATKPLPPLTSASSLTTCQFTQHTPDTMAEDSQSGIFTSCAADSQQRLAHRHSVFRSVVMLSTGRRALEAGLTATGSCEGEGGRRKGEREGERRVQLVQSHLHTHVRTQHNCQELLLSTGGSSRHRELRQGREEECEEGGEGEGREREGDRRVQLVQSNLHTHVLIAQELLNVHCNKSVSVWRA